ncbi:hypothetical protein H5410_060423 [Solanum commersonii]|uniref:Uncharacterized protein n=1 Tax=Solanum commersonii TaxID=4109 RepID=A0A9J5W5E1_SOLCO|nr:hypothetical protein H5410_060423 [Solanum commersonii]
MELPECNSTHWKSKLIDGLPSHFAERVRKAIRGDSPRRTFLVQQIKLNQQIKRHRLNERKQLGEFCEQFAFDVPKQKSKENDYTPRKKASSKKDYEKWKNKRIQRSLEEMKKEKETLLWERRSIPVTITSQILVTKVEDLAIMPEIVESRKRLRALT